MGILNFLASVISSCAWPAVVVFFLYFFREELRHLLPFAHVNLKHNGTEVDLRLDRAEQVASQLPPTPEIAPPPTPEENARFDEIAAEDPEIAMMTAWRTVEHGLDELANAAGLRHERGSSSLYQTRTLRSRGIIDQTTASLLDELRGVRNAIAHSRARYTQEEAHRYRVLAELCNGALASAAQKLVNEK